MNIKRNKIKYTSAEYQTHGDKWISMFYRKYAFTFVMYNEDELKLTEENFT